MARFWPGSDMISGATLQARKNLCNSEVSCRKEEKKNKVEAANTGSSKMRTRVGSWKMYLLDG